MALGPSLRTAVQQGQFPYGYTPHITVPSQVQVGDCLLIFADDTLAITPAGWTLLGGKIYWKVATATDAGSTISVGGCNDQAYLVAYKNAAVTQPLISTGVSNTAPAITTTQPASTVVETWMVISTSSGGVTTFTLPATAEGRFLIAQYPNPPYWAFGISDQTQATAGLAAAETATIAGWHIVQITASLVIFPPAAPAAPILSSPPPNSSQYLAGTPTFSWIPQPSVGDGPQSAYAFRRKTTGAYSYWNATTQAWVGTIVWNTSATAAVTFPAAAWTDPNTYSWSVATQESAVLGDSPFATDSVVYGQVPPTVTPTSPTGVVFIPNPTITWTDTVSVGTSEVSYRAILYSAAEYGATGFDPGATPLFYDSGVTQPYALSQSIPDGTLLNGTYRAYVQITETNNVPSDWSYIQFVVEIEPPNQPTLVATATTDPVTGIPVAALAIQPHDNLLTQVDAGFETGIGTWVGTNATLSQSSAEVEEGADSLKIQAVASGAASATTAAYPI